MLDHISTDIEKGEVVVIIGPSGSGKSTFLRSLNLLETPTGGKIYFEGNDITDKHLNIDAYRQKIGMVFQVLRNLFPHMTIESNPQRLLPRWKGGDVRKGCKIACHARIRSALDLPIRQMPIQASYPAVRSSVSRSVCALCMNPEVLLFDEPTSAFGSGNGR